MSKQYLPHFFAAVVLSGFVFTSVNAAEESDADKRQPITNSIGMNLAPIPAGSFMMGSPRTEAERDREESRHEVTITKPFYMSVYEVTQGEFAKAEPPPADRKISVHFNSNRGGSADHPMENLSWEDAVAYCKVLSEKPEEKKAGRKYRLPTEAEWEYACRAGTKTPFAFGTTLSADQANFNGNYPYDAKKGPYLRMTTKVGSYKPNAFGLYDMHGNVAEWCSDWYDPDYYENSPEEDPQGPPFGVLSDEFKKFYLTVRGGCWLDDARACRSAYRYRAMTRNPYRLIGIRVVCEVEGE